MVAASAVPGRVPLGFVCGYPVGIGGELYGGSMFIKSAASDTYQGKAIQSINERWGQVSSGSGRPWVGRETIGTQVCKKKFSPFQFQVVTVDDDGTGNEKRKFVKVVRMFGCPHHSDLRKEKIERHGVRKGWEPFGQWSLQKAQQLARRETIRLNSKNNNENIVCVRKRNDALPNGRDNPENDTATSKGSYCSDNEEIKSICHNGKCTWKIREKYDNVYNEIMGYSDSSGDEAT